jgi:hypothetical protein
LDNNLAMVWTRLIPRGENMFDTSKICMFLVVVLFNKSCLLVEILVLFDYISFVLFFIGPSAWTSGNMQFLISLWWIMKIAFFAPYVTLRPPFVTKIPFIETKSWFDVLKITNILIKVNNNYLVIY